MLETMKAAIFDMDGTLSQNKHLIHLVKEMNNYIGPKSDPEGKGHKMICIDGNIYALDVLTALKNTPWERKLSKQNVETLFNFFRGSSWFYYKGYTLPYLDRATAQYNPAGKDIRTLLMVRKLLKDWLDSFDSKQMDCIMVPVGFLIMTS